MGKEGRDLTHLPGGKKPDPPSRGVPGKEAADCARDWWPAKAPRMLSAPRASSSSAVKSEDVVGAGGWGAGDWSDRKAKFSG